MKQLPAWMRISLTRGVCSMDCYLVVVLLLATPACSWVTWYDVSVTTWTTPTDQPVNTSAPDKGVVDFLQLLNLTSATSGLSVVQGPDSGQPAYKFRPSFGKVHVPSPGRIAAALTDPAGFTLVFVYRQHRKSLGTLLSVHSPGKVTPWFQLTSNLRTGQLVLHYRITADTKLHQNSWPLQQASSHGWRSNVVGSPENRKIGWTYLTLSLDANSSSFRLQLDCQPPRSQHLAGGSQDVSLNIPQDALVYFRQEPGFKKKFLGSMQVAKLLPFDTREIHSWPCKSLPKKHPSLSYLKKP